MKPAKAQATLELTLSISLAMILLVGMCQLFIWASLNLVHRQSAYRRNLPDYVNSKVKNPGSEFYLSSEANLVPKVRGLDEGALLHATIQEALRLLRSVGTGLQGGRSGAFYDALITDAGIRISYGPASAAELAYYDWQENAIIVNEQIQYGISDAYLAAILAHELLHADYWTNWEYWQSLTRQEHPELTDADLHIGPGPEGWSQNSIDQEYRAFFDEAYTYKELGGSPSDVYYLGLLGIMEQGEAYVKAELALMYAGQNLPDY